MNFPHAIINIQSGLEDWKDWKQYFFEHDIFKHDFFFFSVKHDVINTVSNNECKSFLNKTFILPALIL